MRNADGKLWELYYTATPHYAKMNEYVALATAAKSITGQHYYLYNYGVTAESNRGNHSFRDFDSDMRRVEIGYTWYAQSAQRTHINTNCKFLLLQHAFEVLQANSVISHGYS